MKEKNGKPVLVDRDASEANRKEVALALVLFDLPSPSHFRSTPASPRLYDGGLPRRTRRGEPIPNNDPGDFPCFNPAS